jgi:hypothetical protein
MRTLSTFLIVCALIGGIAVFLFGGAAALRPFEVQARRGVEFESTYAGIAMAWGKLTHTEFALKFSPYCRCVELSAPSTSLLNRISTPVAIAAFGLLSYLLLRFPPGEYARSVSAVLLVFVLTSKVLSPQHLLWIVPFLCVLQGANSSRVRWAFLGSSIFTACVFPLGFPYMLSQSAWPILFLNLRNLLLAYCTVELLRPSFKNSPHGS